MPTTGCGGRSHQIVNSKTTDHALGQLTTIRLSARSTVSVAPKSSLVVVFIFGIQAISHNGPSAGKRHSERPCQVCRHTHRLSLPATGLMKDFLDSLRSQIGDRINSPIFGSFVITWLCWNHQYFF